MIKEFKIKTTKKQGLIDITREVKEIVENSKVSEGICFVYVAHSTAGILINENYDKRVCNDIINKLEELIPEKANYEHDEIDGNAHSHIKSAIIGPSEVIMIKDKELVLGAWQEIALAEFDGPRTRNIFVKVI